MLVNVDVTSDDLFELYRKDYRDSSLVRKIVGKIRGKMKAIRDENEQFEILCDEFFLGKNPESDTELLDVDEESEEK